MKSTQDIIKQSVGSRGKWQDIYKAVYATIKLNTHRVFRHGDTLIWVKLLPEQTAEMFVFTADREGKAMENLSECLKAILAAGFKQIYFDAPYEDSFEFLEPLGFQVESTPYQNGYRGVIRGTR